jgi:hypothetical protein
MSRESGAEFFEECRSGKGVQVGGIEVMAKSWQRNLGRADGAAGLRLRFENENIPAGVREDNSRGEAIEAGADDDEVVAQGRTRARLDATTPRQLREAELIVTPLPFSHAEIG